MSRYISRKIMQPVDKAEQLAAQVAAYEDELRRAYALLWQKQAALDSATVMISELTAKLQIQLSSAMQTPHFERKNPMV